MCFQAFVSAYGAVLLAGGDINFNRTTSTGSTLAKELLYALQQPGAPTLLMQPYHVQQLTAVGAFADLNATNHVEVLEAWTNPLTNRVRA